MVRGAWWAPPSLGALAFVAAVFAVGFERTYEAVLSGRDVLHVSLISVGVLGSFAFGATLAALAARERAFGLAALGVVVPWCVSLALAHLVMTQTPFGVLDGTAPYDRSNVAAMLARPAIVVVAVGAAASAGLALGCWVALASRWRDEPRARVGVLVLAVATLGAGADAVFCATLERTLAQLCGGEVLANMDVLRTAEAAAPIAHVGGLGDARQGLAFLAPSLGVVVTLLAARGSSLRAYVPSAIASLAIVTTPLMSIAAQTWLAESVERWAHPAWLEVEAFEAPSIELGSVDEVEPVGVVFNDRWMDVAGETHEDFSALAAHLRGAADRAEARERERVGEDADVTSSSDPLARGIPRPRSGGRNVVVAVDARVQAARWRTIVDAVREADVRTLCLASRARDDDWTPVPTPARRGVAWIDAITPTPATVACLDTQAAMPPSWPEDQSEVVELRLGAHPYVAARARPGSSPSVAPGVVACDEDGVMRGFPDPTALVTVADEMTTSSFAALFAGALRLEVQPILAWAPLPDTPAQGVEDSPPAALREGSPLAATMLLVHADPPEVAPEHAVEIFTLIEHDPRRTSEEPTYRRAVDRVVGRGASLARCYAEERARDPASGGRVHLDLVVDPRGVPLDTACTRSVRSTEAFCACLEMAVTDEVPDPLGRGQPPTDPSTFDRFAGAPRLTLTLWFQARDADRAPVANPR